MTDAPRLLGIQIANGYSSEARVFAQLLGERADAFDATVIMHQSGSDASAVEPFRLRADCDVVPFDTGWRRNESGVRMAPARLPMIARFLRRISTLTEMARSIEPDVIYSGQQHYDFRAASAVAKRLHLPHIVHLHYTIGPWLKKTVVQGLQEVEHVVTVSDFIRRDALAHDVRPEHVTTVRNASNVMSPVPAERVAALRQELGLPDDAFVVGMASRLDPSKGHLDSLKAFSALAAEQPNAWLLIAGQGTIDTELRSEAAGTSAAERILFLGQRPDVADLFGLFDVFLHPSTDDPCPLAVLEGLASSRPVIAYAQGGAVEMIEHEVTGLLADHGDAVGLGHLLRRVHDDPDLARSLSEAAAVRIDTDFRPADAGARFAAIVRQVTA